MEAITQIMRHRVPESIQNVLLVDWHHDIFLLEDVDLLGPLANAPQTFSLAEKT